MTHPMTSPVLQLLRDEAVAMGALSERLAHHIRRLSEGGRRHARD